MSKVENHDNPHLQTVHLSPLQKMQPQDRPCSHKRCQCQERRNGRNLRMPRMRRNQSYLRAHISLTALQSHRGPNRIGTIVIKRLLPTVAAVAALASTAYTLTLLDQVVNGTLYSYGLQFSYDWANPYWTLLRITLALLAVCAVATMINAIPILRPSSKEKPRSAKTAPAQKITKSTAKPMRINERTATIPIALSPQPPPKPTPKPAPVTSPTPTYADPDAPTLFRCTHCNRTFTQPLRMLNFQVDPPRIVNVCPFCNETMPSDLTVKESEQVENRSFFRKNNNHVQKPFTQ
jgi:hypothetical protein